MNKKIVRGLALVGAAVAAGSASAQSEGITAITELSTQATSYITAAFGVAVIVAGGFWGIKMMKKAFSRAG